MLKIEYKENSQEIGNIIDSEFNKYANKNGVICNYKSFVFAAKEDEKIIGIITGHSFYKEVHISDLIVYEQYRNKHIGSMLVQEVENYHKGKHFDNINLTTYAFQAPDFYKKCGYTVEYIRENKENPKLSKYFLIKYL